MATYDINLGDPNENTFKIPNFRGQLHFAYEHREVDAQNPTREIGTGHFPATGSVWVPRRVIAAYVDHKAAAIPFQVGQKLEKPDWIGKTVKLTWESVPGWSGYFLEDKPGEDSVRFW